MTGTTPFTILQKTVVIYAVCLLSATAVLKLGSIAFDADLATQKDAVIHFLSSRALLFNVALLELIVVAVCLRKNIPSVYKHGAIFWLAGAFAFYRLWPWLTTGRWAPCKCMGSFRLLNDNSTIQAVILLALAVLILGSGSVLVTVALDRKGTLTSSR